MAHFTEILKLEECLKQMAYKKYPDYSDFRAEFIDFLNINFYKQQGFFDPSKTIGREFNGFVWSELNDSWTGVVITKGHFKHTMVSVLNNKPLIIRGYPMVLREMQDNDMDEYEHKGYFVPKYDGVLLSTYIMPNGEFFGKTKEIEYIDRNGGMNVNFLKILKDLNVKDKLEALSNEYNCVVHGMLCGRELSGDESKDYKYIACDISDRNNHTFYTKEMAIRIFKEHGLECESTYSNEESHDVLNEYNGVIFKIYDSGDLKIYKKEIEVSEAIRCKRAVRDAHALACDFCWTNPSYDDRLKIILDEHGLIDFKSLDWLRDKIYNPEPNQERTKKIKSYLNKHYIKIKDMNVDDIFETLKWKWEWSALAEKEIVCPIISEWLKDIKDVNLAKELEKEKHADAIYFK